MIFSSVSPVSVFFFLSLKFNFVVFNEKFRPGLCIIYLKTKYKELYINLLKPYIMSIHEPFIVVLSVLQIKGLNYVFLSYLFLQRMVKKLRVVAFSNKINTDIRLA